MSARRSVSWSLKGDGTLVTALDVRNEEILRCELERLHPGSYFIGEETLDKCTEEYLQDAFRGDCWIVDPIDGTSPFAHGYPMWAVSIGLMREGRLVDGGVILPEEGIVLVTDGCHVKIARNVDVLHGQCPVLQDILPVHSEGWNDGGMILLGQEVTRRYTINSRNPVLATGSAVHAIAHLLLGQGILYVGTVKLYDVAGVLPMAVRLGLETSFAESGEISLCVDDSFCHLGATDERRWRLRGTLAVGTNQTLACMKEKLNLERH